MEMEEGLEKVYHGCSASVPSLSERLHCLPCCPNGTFSFFLTGQVLSLVGSICCPFSLTLEDQVSLYIAHWCLKSRTHAKQLLEALEVMQATWGVAAWENSPALPEVSGVRQLPSHPPHPSPTPATLHWSSGPHF